MSRMCIFVFFNAEGVVYPHVYNIINETIKYVDYLCIVVNGCVDEEGYKNFLELSDRLLIRENRGYDAGAYKDAIHMLDQEGVMREHDELLMLNDSFFGFLYPLSEFFEYVDEDKKTDFWGITYTEAGFVKNNIPYKKHIQSYFMLIRKRMLHSKFFIQYWVDMPYSDGFYDTVLKFETTFTPYFSEKGFLWRVYCDARRMGLGEKDNVHLYSYKPFDLISQLRCPLLKIKPIEIINANAMQALEYIENENLYDTGIIREYLYGVREIDPPKRLLFTPDTLRSFCGRFEKIYIYGAGFYGKGLKKWLEKRGYPVAGFIVTNIEGNDISLPMTEYKNFEMADDKGIIVGMCREYTEKVKAVLSKNVSSRNVLYADF